MKKTSTERAKKFRKAHDIKQINVSAVATDIEALKDKIEEVKAKYPHIRLTNNFAVIEFALNKVLFSS